MAQDASFQESDHPRGEGGKFAEVEAMRSHAEKKGWKVLHKADHTTPGGNEGTSTHEKHENGVKNYLHIHHSGNFQHEKGHSHSKLGYSATYKSGEGLEELKKHLDKDHNNEDW